MPNNNKKSKYTEKQFKLDLQELNNLIENYNSKKGGGAKGETRFFKLHSLKINGKKHDLGDYRGRYKSDVSDSGKTDASPLQAATRAYGGLSSKSNKFKIKVKDSIEFEIIETTQGSSKKVYGPYVGTTETLPKSKWTTVVFKDKKGKKVKQVFKRKKSVHLK